jgi:hypothetical protein
MYMYIVRVCVRFLLQVFTEKPCCTECQTNYHNNFSVQDGVRTYYMGIPSYILVGEHQYVEVKVVRMWIAQMLLGWYVFFASIYVHSQVLKVFGYQCCSAL